MLTVNLYPYTNFHELNLDWILEEVKKLKETVDNIATPDITKEEFDQLRASVYALEQAVAGMQSVPTPSTSDIGKFLRAGDSGNYVLDRLTNLAEEGG